MKYSIAALSPDGYRHFEGDEFLAKGSKPVLYVGLKYVEAWRKHGIRRLKARDDLPDAKVVICLWPE